jgi:ATP-dependent Lhr-like helicase
LADRLWEEVWQGRVTNDTFISLRRGIENRFKVPALALIGADETRPGQGPRRRARFSRWKGSLPFAGNWFELDRLEMSDDLIEVEERNKDRVRILLDRYGILFREMLSKEMTPFNWPDLFRSLRLMELSGEVLAGYFFHGIPGPQFISHQAFRSLQRQLPDDKIFWINATDPVSLCGRGLEELKGRLPRRLDSTHLVYRGPELVLVSERNGKALTFNVPPDDPDIQYFLSPLRHLLQRGFMHHKRIQIETINGDEASKSPYVEVLRTGFELMVETRGVTLYRKVV